MTLDDDDKRWISDQLERVETKLLTGLQQGATPVDIRQGTVFAAIPGEFCRYCGQTYDQHKAYPHGECQDRARQG